MVPKTKADHLRSGAINHALKKPSRMILRRLLGAPSNAIYGESSANDEVPKMFEPIRKLSYLTLGIVFHTPMPCLMSYNGIELKFFFLFYFLGFDKLSLQKQSEGLPDAWWESRQPGHCKMKFRLIARKKEATDYNNEHPQCKIYYFTAQYQQSTTMT